MTKHGIKIFRACKICGISQSAYYYKPRKRKKDEEIKQSLLKLAKEYPRRGFDKMMKMLKKANKPWNHKRVYRMYCELKLNLRKKPKKRLPSREAKSLLQPIERNLCWSIDFMSDALTNGLRFRTFNVIDDFNREGLGIIASTSFPSSSVTDQLDKIAETKGYPESIRVDNGPEFISKHFVDWANSHDIKLIHIQPGKPAQNGYIERFNRTYREEVLDCYLFDSIFEVQLITDQWLNNYNHHWCHNSLDDLSPIEFARRQEGLAPPGGTKREVSYET